MPAAMASKNRKSKMKGIAMDVSDMYEEEEEEEEEEEKVGFRRRKKGVDEAGVDTPIRPPPNPTTPPERGMAWDYFFMDNMQQSNLNEVEEEEEGYVEDRNGNLEEKFNSVGGNDEFRTPEKQAGFEVIEEFKTPDETPVQKMFLHSNTAPPTMSRMGYVGNVVGNNNGVDFLKILSDIDDHFLKASQCSQEVSKMLEATRLHYHSNFADNRGDHLIISN